MQISAIPPILPTTATDRQAAQQGAAQKGARNEAQADPAKPAQDTKAETVEKVWTPAPPLRPNIQDYVDINRTLIALRTL